MKRRTSAKADCEIRLDRLTVGVPNTLPEGLPDLRGFKLTTDTLVRPKGAIRTYERVRWYRSKNNSCKVSIDYQRLAPWLPTCRVTIYADDQTGITVDELKRVLADFPDHRISLAEVAFDFHPDTAVNREFVLRHMRFGKSRRQKNRGGLDQLRYGTRRSPKLVRCYWKKTIQRYRIELEPHGVLLKKLSIRNIAHLPKIEKLCPGHIAVKRLNWDKLKSYLTARHGKAKGDHLYEQARECAGISLRRLLRFLKPVVHNPHRFFESGRLNLTIREALLRWVAEFSIDEDDRSPQK